jgi:hypothetical protein
MSQTAPVSARYRSKTITAWLALFLGALGAHRFYLKGFSDRLAWLYLPPSLVGLYGLLRMRALGPEDAMSALLVPLIGVTLSLGMLAGVVAALTPDEKWDARHNPDLPGRSTGWGAVLAAAVGLFVGATVLLSTIAFTGQRYFEWLAQPKPATAATRAETRTASR